jgi:hypothetical protein
MRPNKPCPQGTVEQLTEALVTHPLYHAVLAAKFSTEDEAVLAERCGHAPGFLFGCVAKHVTARLHWYRAPGWWGHTCTEFGCQFGMVGPRWHNFGSNLWDGGALLAYMLA